MPDVRSGYNQKGFTLVELMGVVLIIGILVAIAVPLYNSNQNTARINAHNANVRIIESAASSYIANHPGTALSIAATPAGATPAAFSNYLQTWPRNPIVAGSPGAGNYALEITAGGLITVTPAKQ